MKKNIPEAADESVSKSQLKRQAGALFELGKRLVDLPAARLRRLPLPEQVREAVDEARSIRARVAHKRQLQFLAKQLRGIDTSAIEAALEKTQGDARAEIQRQHRVEHWRDRLLAEGDGALQQLLAHNRRIERQQLRQLVRQAALQAKLEQPPSAARELFRALREIDLEDALPESNHLRT